MRRPCLSPGPGLAADPRGLLGHAVLVAGLIAVPFTTPAPAVAAQERQICIGDSVDRGWIVVDAKWNPTRCGDADGIQDNVWVIARYDDKPEGATMEICAFEDAPRGWEVVSSRWNPTRCEDVEGMQDTVKTIRRLAGSGGGGDYERPRPRPDNPREITGMYSDMRGSSTTGDVVGTEVFILYSTDGMRGRYYALVQFAEGVPEPPELVDVYLRGSEIEFDASFMGYRMRFRGRVSGRYLEGEFDGPVGHVRLERRASFWH